MASVIDEPYIVGTYAMPSNGKSRPGEKKSPPLSAFVENPTRYAMPSSERYYDPAFVKLEWDRLWTKTWLCAGRVSDVATPGAWFRFDLGQESFIIVRSNEDEIKALYNVCPHRANRLIDDPFGRTPAFVCPYHSWTFDRGGQCKRVTDRELFQPEVLAGNLDLKAVRCETWDGFVFINMDSGAAPLADYLGEITEIMADYHLDRMEVRSDVMLALDCNWKTILDAFSENYHVHITHSFAMPITEDKISQMDFYPGGHTRRMVALGDQALRRGQEAGLHPMQADLLRSVGIDPETFEGGGRDVRRAVQIAKRAMPSPDGDIYADLSDNQLTDDWAVNIFPNMHLSLHAEGALMMRYLPDRQDPNKCSLHIVVLAHTGKSFPFYLPESTEMTTTGRPARVHVRHDDEDVIEKIGQLLFEDIRNTRETQLGLQSRGFSKMRLSEHEQPIMYQHAIMERYLYSTPVP